MKFNELAIIYSAFLFLGLLFTIISAFLPSKTVSIVNILAYSCLIAGVLLIVGQMMIQLRQTVSGNSTLSFWELSNIMKNNVGPFVCVLGVLGFLLYMNIQFKDKIASGHLPDDYYLFNNLNIFVILAEAVIFFTGMQQTQGSDTLYLPLSYGTFLYFLFLVNVNMALIQYNILRYFTTDG